MAVSNVRNGNAPEVGYGGSVTTSLFTMNVKSWAGSWQVQNVDTTCISDGVSYFDPAHVGPFTATIVGQITHSSAVFPAIGGTDSPTLANASASVTLQKGGGSFSFTGNITSGDISRNNLEGDVTISVIATGPVTES